MRYLLLLLVLFPSISSACRCIDRGEFENYQSDYPIAFLAVLEEVASDSLGLTLQPRVVEVFRGDIPINLNPIVYKGRLTSCDIQIKHEDMLLALIKEGENTIILSQCSPSKLLWDLEINDNDWREKFQ